MVVRGKVWARVQAKTHARLSYGVFFPTTIISALYDARRKMWHALVALSIYKLDLLLPVLHF